MTTLLALEAEAPTQEIKILLSKRRGVTKTPDQLAYHISKYQEQLDHVHPEALKLVSSKIRHYQRLLHEHEMRYGR